MLSCFSRVRLSTTLGTVAHQAPLSMGFSRQEHWSGLLCPPLGDLPDPGIQPASFVSPALAGVFFTTSTTLCDGLNGSSSQNSTFLLLRVCVTLTIPSSQKHPIFQDSKTCCYLKCAYERKQSCQLNYVTQL